MWCKTHNLDSCKGCGTSERKHNAKGFCKRCYGKQYIPIVWSRNYKECINCNSTERPHTAHGYCDRCYSLNYNFHDPIPSCQCGCGLPVTIRRGKPKNFRKGHWIRAQGPGTEFYQLNKERSTGENNPCYGLFGKDHPAYGHETTQETRELRRQTALKRIQNFRGKKTDIEKILSKLLDRMNLAHEPQYIIGDKFIVDEFLSDYNVIIEAWGDFWHANPKRFSKDELTEIQKKNVIKDDSRLKYLKTCGYTVITLWGYDLKNNIVKCQETIQDAILSRR